VLKYAAADTSEIPIRASSIAEQVFENWNLDLIQGLYKGSPSETWENLGVIAEIRRPPHLYHGRFADRLRTMYKMESRHAVSRVRSQHCLGVCLLARNGCAWISSDRRESLRARTSVHRSIQENPDIASSNLLGSEQHHIHTLAQGRERDCRGYVFAMSEYSLLRELYFDRQCSMCTGRIIAKRSVGHILCQDFVTDGRR